MKILYCRVSTIEQSTDRQRADQNNYNLVIEDKVSGAIPFFERDGGTEIRKLIEKEIISSLHVWTIDRLGRDMRDILNTIHFFTEKKIPIHFESQKLCTLDSDGHENPIAKLIISIMGCVSEMERNQIHERQQQGIYYAKLKGKFNGRKKGTSEDILKFLSKPKNKKALDLMKKGYKITEIKAITGLDRNTLYKIKKKGMVSDAA
jgi:DNA invertase Pin-like site-specific DNA recombinase